MSFCKKLVQSGIEALGAKKCHDIPYASGKSSKTTDAEMLSLQLQIKSQALN